MRLTERTDYALRVLMLLAATRDRLTVPSMAADLNVSANHLTKVVQQLQALGWVTTHAGRSGGVELSHRPAALSVADVVLAIEPDLGLVECFRDGGYCPLQQGPCRLRHALDRARRAFMDALESVTLADLIKGRHKAFVQLTAPDGPPSR